MQTPTSGKMPWHVPPPVQASASLVLQSFWHRPVLGLHMCPSSHGQGSQVRPAPIGTQLVVPSFFTMVQVSPSGQAFVKGTQLSAGLQTGIFRSPPWRKLSVAGSGAQKCSVGQSRSAQQYARQVPERSPAQPAPSGQPDDATQAAPSPVVSETGAQMLFGSRSEERRVGKERRSRRSPYH